MEKTNNTNTNTNATKVNAPKVNARSAYARSKEHKARTFSFYNRMVCEDVDALFISGVREDLKRAKDAYKTDKNTENKQRVDTLAARVACAENVLASIEGAQDVRYLESILNGCKMTREDVNPTFIKTFAPECVYNDMFCKLSKVAPECVTETKARYASNPLVTFFATEDGTIMKRTIIDVWTCQTLLSLYGRAARNRIIARRAKSQAERDVETLAKLREESKRLNARREQVDARLKALEESERAAKDAISAPELTSKANESETLAKVVEDANAINARENA